MRMKSSSLPYRLAARVKQHLIQSSWHSEEPDEEQLRKLAMDRRRGSVKKRGVERQKAVTSTWLVLIENEYLSRSICLDLLR